MNPLQRRWQPMAEHDGYDSTGPEEDAVDVRQMFLDWLTSHLATVEVVGTKLC